MNISWIIKTSVSVFLAVLYGIDFMMLFGGTIVEPGVLVTVFSGLTLLYFLVISSAFNSPAIRPKDIHRKSRVGLYSVSLGILAAFIFLDGRVSDRVPRL